MNQLEMEQLGKVHAFRSSMDMYAEGEHLYYEGDQCQHVPGLLGAL